MPAKKKTKKRQYIESKSAPQNRSAKRARYVGGSQEEKVSNPRGSSEKKSRSREVSVSAQVSTSEGESKMPQYTVAESANISHRNAVLRQVNVSEINEIEQSNVANAGVLPSYMFPRMSLNKSGPYVQVELLGVFGLDDKGRQSMVSPNKIQDTSEPSDKYEKGMHAEPKLADQIQKYLEARGMERIHENLIGALTKLILIIGQTTQPCQDCQNKYLELAQYLVAQFHCEVNILGCGANVWDNVTVEKQLFPGRFVWLVQANTESRDGHFTVVGKEDTGSAASTNINDIFQALEKMPSP